MAKAQEKTAPKLIKNLTISKAPNRDLTGEIRAKASELWEKKGRAPGKDVENWLEAERIVKGNLR